MQTKLMRLLLFGALGLGIGCGSVPANNSDASVVADAGSTADGRVDAGSPPDAIPLPDAIPSPDANPQAPREGTEQTGTGGRVSGGAYTVDVQMGHWVPQRSAIGGSKSVEGAALIK